MSQAAGEIRRNVGNGPQGTLMRAGGKDGPQMVRSQGDRWTDEAEAIFLDHLAASCNVTLSAKAVGFSREAIYRRRRNDPGFAERWQAALEQGYARIEMLLVRRAAETLEGSLQEPREPDPDTPLPEMTVRDAIAILQLHRSSVKGDGRSPGWRARPRSLDEMRDSILAKLEAVEAARRAGQRPESLPVHEPRA